MERFVEIAVNIGIAIGVVYGLAYLTGQDPNNIVGWAALGMAASAKV